MVKVMQEREAEAENKSNLSPGTSHEMSSWAPLLQNCLPEAGTPVVGRYAV